jgi:hypothetical protein
MRLYQDVVLFLGPLVLLDVWINLVYEAFSYEAFSY